MDNENILEKTEFRLAMLTLNLYDIRKFREEAEDVVYRYIKPKFCSVDLTGTLYVEGEFDYNQYAALAFCQTMFRSLAESINFRGLQDEIEN